MAGGINHLTPDDRVPTDISAHLADKLAEAVANNHSVLLTGPVDPRPLFAAAARHPALLRSTAFHVGQPLDVVSMLRQVTADDGPEDAILEQGFASLTAPGPGSERIVLFVAEAHLLPHATVRYIEFALHAGPHLTVVLAGQNGLMDMLALDGFARLRNRIAVHLVLPDVGAAHMDVPSAALVPSLPNPALTYRMTPPRLLAAAVAAAGLAAVGIVSLSLPAPQVTAVSADPGAAPSVTAVEPPPEPASAQRVPVDFADSVQALDAGKVVAQQAPAAALLPSMANEVNPFLAAEAPAGAGIVAVAPPEIAPPSWSAAEATDRPSGASSNAGAVGIADAPAQPGTAQAGAPGPTPGYVLEFNPEVAEAPSAADLHPTVPLEPYAFSPDQVDPPGLGMVTGPAAAPAARPDNVGDVAARLPPTA